MSGASPTTFVVRSPLQILNALEARFHYRLDPADCHLLVLPSESPEGAAQVGELLVRFPWERVMLLGDADRAPAVVVQGSSIVLGDCRDGAQRACAHRAADPCPVVLDDGNATLLVARTRAEPLRALRSRHRAFLRPGHRRLPRPRVLADLVHPSQRELRAVEMFTIYDVPVTRRDRRTRHDMAHLRSLTPTPLRPLPLFVGSPLVETGMLTAAQYDEVVDTAHDRHPGLVYVPHRREGAGKLAAIERRGVPLLVPSLPLELELIDQGIEPAPLIVVVSTASDTIPLIMPGVEVRRLLPTDLDLAARRNRQLALMLALQGRTG